MLEASVRMPKGSYRGQNTSSRSTDRFIEDNNAKNERANYSMFKQKFKIFNLLIICTCL